jgi:hypothetical protein
MGWIATALSNSFLGKVEGSSTNGANCSMSALKLFFDLMQAPVILINLRTMFYLKRR